MLQPIQPQSPRATRPGLTGSWVLMRAAHAINIQGNLMIMRSVNQGTALIMRMAALVP